MLLIIRDVPEQIFPLEPYPVAEALIAASVRAGLDNGAGSGGRARKECKA